MKKNYSQIKYCIIRLWKNYLFEIIIFLSIFLVFFILDLINIRTIFSPKYNGVHLYNINVDAWVSLLASVFAVLGTYYFTNRSNTKLLKQKECELRQNQEEFNKHMEILERNNQTMINKNNIDQIFNSLEDYYMLREYTVLLSQFLVRESVNLHIEIFSNFESMHNYLEKLEKDFRYDQDIKNTIKKEKLIIRKLLDNHTKKEYDSISGNIDHIFDDFNVILNKIYYNSEVLEVFGFESFFSIEVYKKFTEHILSDYNSNYRSHERDIKKNGFINSYETLNINFHYKIIYFLYYISDIHIYLHYHHLQISNNFCVVCTFKLLEINGYFEIYFYETFNPDDFEERNGIKLKDYLDDLYNGDKIDITLTEELSLKVEKKNDKLIIVAIKTKLLDKQYLISYIEKRMKDQNINISSHKFNGKIIYI